MINTSNMVKLENSEFRVGPFSPFIPGPAEYRFFLEGDIIQKVEIRDGFAFRNLEEKFKNLPIKKIGPFVSRIDPECSLFYQNLFYTCVEEILKKELSDQITKSRMIVVEINRITSHLKFLMNNAKVNGLTIPFHFFARERESFLDLLELVTGSRFGFDYFCVGGLITKLTEGFLEKTLKACSSLGHRKSMLYDLFFMNPTLLGKTKDLGIVSFEDATNNHLRGVSARASGITSDRRRLLIESVCDVGIYERTIAKTPLIHMDGDVYSRIESRFFEIYQSVNIIENLLNTIKLEKHPISVEQSEIKELNSGEAIQIMDGPRGEMGIYVVLGDGGRIVRLQVLPASIEYKAKLIVLLRGEKIENFNAIAASFDLSFAEMEQ